MLNEPNDTIIRSSELAQTHVSVSRDPSVKGGLTEGLPLC